MNHINNLEEIKASKKVGCLYCHKVSEVTELEWLEEHFLNVLENNTYCPKCSVADMLIGDASGIELTETNLKILEFEFKK